MCSNFEKVVVLNQAMGNQKGKIYDIDWDAIETQKHLIDEECNKEMFPAIADRDVKELVDAAGDLLVVTYGMLHKLGVDADELMAEIDRSNMSKVCATVEELKDTIAWYENKGIEVDYKVVYDNNDVDIGWFVISDRDQEVDGKFYPKGKGLKNINWSEPDIEQFLS